jgi:hypothetical protein
MPSINTSPHNAKKVMDASIPKNMGQAELEKLRAGWAKAAQERAQSIEEHNRTPLDSTKCLKIELRKFGQHWNAYVFEGTKRRALLPSPSLFSSAMEQLDNWLEDEAFK